MSRIGFPLMALVLTTGCTGREATSPIARNIHPAVATASRDEESGSESPRSGALHVTKECSQYTRLAGSFCTITSSNLKQIEVGSKVIYTIDSGPTVLDSDVTLEPPGPGNNRAFGHCRLDLVTRVGLCTFSGGTGKFTWFNASAAVSSLGRPNWAWDGTYRFGKSD
jgi:hypothetical protein